LCLKEPDTTFGFDNLPSQSIDHFPSWADANQLKRLLERVHSSASRVHARLRVVQRLLSAHLLAHQLGGALQSDFCVGKICLGLVCIRSGGRNLLRTRSAYQFLKPGLQCLQLPLGPLQLSFVLIIL